MLYVRTDKKSVSQTIQKFFETFVDISGCKINTWRSQASYIGSKRKSNEKGTKWLTFKYPDIKKTFQIKQNLKAIQNIEIIYELDNKKKINAP